MTMIKKSPFMLVAMLALTVHSTSAQQNANIPRALAETSEAQPGNADIAGLPAGRGIYYHAATGWVALQFTVLMPFVDPRGPDPVTRPAIVSMPGPHAHVQIVDDARPILYLRGIVLDQLCLVRATSKSEHRELLIPISKNVQEWGYFRPQDVAEIALRDVGANVVSVKPLADLKSGEYALAAAVEPGGRVVRLGYDFGLTVARAGK